MFADDFMLYYTGNNWDRIYNIVQNKLNVFTKWITDNML